MYDIGAVAKVKAQSKSVLHGPCLGCMSVSDFKTLTILIKETSTLDMLQINSQHQQLRLDRITLGKLKDIGTTATFIRAEFCNSSG